MIQDNGGQGNSRYFYNKLLSMDPSVGATTLFPTTITRERPMPKYFEPSNWTVICGRGHKAFHHVGNRRFRVLCEVGAEKYRQSSNKIERSTIVYGIVESIKEADGGGFVRWNSNEERWYQVTDNAARDKTSMCIRNLLTSTKLSVLRNMSSLAEWKGNNDSDERKSSKRKASEAYEDTEFTSQQSEQLRLLMLTTKDIAVDSSSLYDNDDFDDTEPIPYPPSTKPTI